MRAPKIHKLQWRERESAIFALQIAIAIGASKMESHFLKLLVTYPVDSDWPSVAGCLAVELGHSLGSVHY